jgi:hypothetical protein
MSGDFRVFGELFSWVYALTRIEPGDFASVDKRDDAETREFNAAWGYRVTPCMGCNYAGVEL